MSTPVRDVRLDRHIEELRERELQERFQRRRRDARRRSVVRQPGRDTGRPLHKIKERDASRAVELARRQDEDAVPSGYGLELFLADQPGHPLGPGMPMGAPLRMDGESHSNAWRRVLRSDPCAYCEAGVSGTVDHIEPKSAGKRDRERWVNLVGACERCNCQKSARPLLLFLRGA